MRFELGTQGIAVTSNLSKFFSEFVGDKKGSPISADLMGKVTGKFFGLNPKEQVQFSRNLEEILLHQVSGLNIGEKNLESSSKNDYVTRGYATVVGLKDGLDVIVDHLENLIQTININRGGMGANTAQVLGQLGHQAVYVPRFGEGPIADLQRAELTAAGLDTNNLFKAETDGDVYIVPCINLIGDDLFWLVPNRIQLSEEDEEKFISKIVEAVKDHSSKVLVIACGESSDNFTADLAEAADNEDAFVIYNANEYDKTGAADRNLFASKKLGMAKPNANEFTQLLVSAGILPKKNEESKLQELKNKAKVGNFSEHIDLAKELLKRTSMKLVLVSLGKQGALLVSNRFAVHAKPPHIDPLCPSGAGDSGLAAFIAALASHKIDPRDIESEDDAQLLVEEFTLAGAAATSLPGNTLPTAQLINNLRLSQMHTVLPKDMVTLDTGATVISGNIEQDS